MTRFIQFHINLLCLLLLFQTAWFSGWVQYESKKDISLSLFTQSWLWFFFLSVWGQRCSVPTVRSCFHPWIWSIMDGTPTASQAGLARKKTWKTSRNSASPGARRRRRGHAWPPISTGISQSLAGCDCLEARSKTHAHTHTQTDTSVELLTYSPNHFIDLWAKDVKAYWGHH